MTADSDSRVDVFVSFAHEDLPGTARASLEAVLMMLQEEHARFTPDRLRIFLDYQTIHSMQDWEHRILGGLRDAGVLLALVGGGYFRSRWCQREWETWERHERDRGVEESLAPVYVATVAEIDRGKTGQASPMLQDILRRQYVDLRKWWGKDAALLRNSELRERVARLEQDIANKLEEVRQGQRSRTTIPSPSEHFVGRVETLRQVREALSVDRVGTVAVLHGLAGTGKSAVAFEYAHRFASQYPGGRFLVQCEGLTDIRDALIAIAPDLGVALSGEEQVDKKRGAAKIRAALQARETTLLLLDNVDTLSVLAPSARAELLPNDTRIHLLATTRLDAASLSESRLIPLALDSLPPDDGKTLLSRYRPFQDPADEAAAALIVERVEGHPLTLEVVAVYLWQQMAAGVTYAGYLQRLQTEGLAALEAAGADSDVVVSGNATERLPARLEPTLVSLSEEELFALGLAALLPATAIALPWLESLTKAQFPALAKTAPGYPDPWLRIRRRLLGLRLLASGSDDRLVRMHRLVRDIVAARLPAAHRTRCQELLANHAAARGELLFAGWADPQARWEVEPLHLFATSQLERDGSEAGLKLANWVHQPLTRLARFREALPLARLALQRAKDTLPGDSALAVTLASNLANLLADLGDPLAGRRLLGQAIVNEEQRQTRRGKLLATLLANLARLELASERPEAARAALERVLELGKSKSEDLDLAGILSNLAVALRMLGEPQAARERLLQAVAIQQRLLPADHPDLASTYQNLANVEGQLGNPKAARDYLTRAVAIDEAALAADHPERAARLMNLALMESSAGDVQAAHERLLRAVAVLERSHGPHHAVLAVALENLAGVEAQLGQLDAAKANYRRSATIQAQALEAAALAAPSPRAQFLLAETYWKLGMAETFSADWAPARNAFLASIRIREQSSAADPKRNLVYSSLAGVHMQLGELDKAREALLKCLQIEEESGQDGYLPETLSQLASVERSLGKNAEARLHVLRLTSILESQELLEPAQEAMLGGGYVALATLDQEQERFEDARASGERALALLEHVMERDESPEARSQFMQFLLWLANLHEAVGDAARASALRRRSDSIAGKLLEHPPRTAGERPAVLHAAPTTQDGKRFR